MLFRVVFIFFFVWFFTACSTINVEQDYNPTFDFSKIKTFSVLHQERVGENTLVNERIQNAIKKTLQAKGLRFVAPNKADVVALFHLNVQNKTQIYTDYQMVGYGRYGGMMIATPRSYNYDEGKLIIDLYDPKTNKTVYRTVVTDEIESKKTPQEREAYITEVIQKAFEKFPPQ